MIELLRFHYPVIVRAIAAALSNGLLVLITWAITRWVLRRRFVGFARDELVETIRAKQGQLNRERQRADALEAEVGRLRSLIIGNTALASQLLSNHQAASDQARSAQG
jgi:hypothetical protein